MKDKKKLKCRGRNWKWKNAFVRGGTKDALKEIC